MKQICILVSLLVLSSCTTLKKCNERFPPKVETVTIHKDSTIYRDTTIYIYIKGETIHDTTKVYIDRSGLIQSDISFLNTQYSWSKAWVNNSRLFHTLVQRDDSISSTIRNAIKNQSKIEYITTTTIEKVERSLSWWQTLQIWCGRVFLTCLILIIIFMVLKAVRL
jgi:hypothetical protein